MEGTSDHSAKVAIPRLRRPVQQSAPSLKPPRVRSVAVSQACTRCRKRTIKCSGTRPRCTNCESQVDECTYDQPRRDRLRDALTKNERLTDLLRELRIHVDGIKARQIDDLLVQYDSETPPSTTPSIPTRSMKERPQSSSDNMEDDSKDPNEAQVAASVGSNEDVEFIDEDLLEEQGPNGPGFMGRSSQVQWMRTLQRQLNQPEGESSDLPYAPPGRSQKSVDKRAYALHQREDRLLKKLPVREFYFYLDNENLDVLETVDPDAMPSVETAERLSELYQQVVHTPFRILDDTFFDQLRTYYKMAQRGSELNVCSKWKATMNLVFAIGARYSHLSSADGEADDRDHIVYMLRAVHFLELTKLKMLACAPDKNMIQATGLLSFYYLAIGHASRAWYMIGISLRHAQAAGFHLRNEDIKMPLAKKRAIAHTWWALHSIECILTSITGRPRVIYQNDCTVPLLKSLRKGDSRETELTSAALKSQTRLTSGSSAPPTRTHTYLKPTESAAILDTFLDAWINLDIIQHKTVSILYSPGTAVHSWKHVQGEISVLITELDEWAREALEHRLLDSSTSTNPSQRRERLLLYMYYQSVKICVTRPCLCRLDRRIQGQSDPSARFNQKTADTCIQAALELAFCMPEPTSLQWLYSKGCWWSSVHIIMQAITVLLLELVQGTSRLSGYSSEIATGVEKLTRWLILMKTVDTLAGRAYIMVRNMLRKHNQFARQMVPGSWLDETMQPTGPDPTTFVNLGAQSHLGPDPQSFPETSYSEISFGNDYDTTTNDGTFGSNDLVDPLAHPYDGSQFEQPQYPLFYGDQFTTLFDQEMDDGFGDNTNMED